MQCSITFRWVSATSIAVVDFYDAALRPLGLVRIVDFGRGRGSDYGAVPARSA
jgi:hypothetical protein